MKKIFSILATASMMLIATSAFAQLHVGAGYLNSTDRYRSDADAEPTNGKMNGVYAGAGYSIPIMAGLKVTPGVYYQFFAKNDMDSLGPVSISGDLKEHFILVPLSLSYGLDLSPDFKVFIYGGPTFSVGLSSKSKLTGEIGPFGGDMTVDNYEETYTRFDCLMGGGIGVQVFKHYRLNVGYDFGLVNRYIGDGDDIRHRNQLSAGLAYVF